MIGCHRSKNATLVSTSGVRAVVDHFVGVVGVVSAAGRGAGSVTGANIDKVVLWASGSPGDCCRAPPPLASGATSLWYVPRQPYLVVCLPFPGAASIDGLGLDWNPRI